MKKTISIISAFLLFISLLAGAQANAAPWAVSSEDPAVQTAENINRNDPDTMPEEGETTPSENDRRTPDTIPGGGNTNPKVSGEQNPKPEDPDKQYNTTYQLTEDDIFAMNNGNAAMLYTDGYLTFLRGRYYDGKVENMEDGVKSLDGVASLVGLSQGSEFFCVYSQISSSGYTTYTYQQRYGDFTLENAVLKIIVDPDGYTAGLISSFVPNAGLSDEKSDFSITPEQAQQIVADYYPEENFTFFPENTRQTSVTFAGIAYHAFAVFTDFPSDFAPLEGGSYLQHLVSYDGSYLFYTVVSSPQEMTLGDTAQMEQALSWFDGMKTESYTGTVTLHDGTKKELTVPVAKDGDGKYYLADPERHILLADYYSFIFGGENIIPHVSDDNTGWPEKYLITYATYIKVRDFFAKYGLESVDGFGTPMLILTEACEQDGSPIDNAFFSGFFNGWAIFGANAINDYGECVDVLGHEFTHGITRYTMVGRKYENESGALNESISDIMGNLAEMILEETDDTDWLIAENSGYPVRCMAFPWLYEQPAEIGGLYYMEPTPNPTLHNDLGGVHTNSSLPNYVAWMLHAQGMPLEEEFLLWLEVCNLLTAQSGFREVHQALLFAAEMRNLDIKWFGIIEMTCEMAGF